MGKPDGKVAIVTGAVQWAADGHETLSLRVPTGLPADLP
jgi:hypothetical protein